MREFPKKRTDWQSLRQRMVSFREADIDWRRGRSSLHVYHAGDDVLEVARDAYVMFMTENALAPAAFPSLARMELEIVDAALALFNAPAEGRGNVTSGGTESIFLAVKAARDWDVAQRGQRRKPAEILLPSTAHPAFDKAAHYLGLFPVRVATGANHRADVEAMAARINERTLMIVGSAPSLPFGLFDPIERLAGLACEHGLWLHVDACIGGYLTPFVKKLGYPTAAFDFSVPGVRSLSADLHKYGYAAKGASTIMYADAEAYSFQGTSFSDWPKGTYQSTTFMGTRSGGVLSSAWAVMHYLGEEGYLSLAARVMDLRRKYLDAIQAIDDLKIIGEPELSIFAFTSHTIDVMAVADALTERGWYISRTSYPPGIHQMLNISHEAAAEYYLQELSALTHDVARRRLTSRPAQVCTY